MVLAISRLEMPAALLMPRLLSLKLWAPGTASPSYAAMLRGAVNENDLRWAEGVATELKGWALTIDDEPGLTAPEIEARARVMASRFKASGKQLGLVVVDHIHKMHAPGHTSKAAEFSEVSAMLAEAAKRLDVPLLALAQLNRSVESREDKRPELSDLRESGGLEQDADVVLLCFREAYYLERKSCKSAGADSARLADLHAKANDLEIIVGKQRSRPCRQRAPVGRHGVERHPRHKRGSMSDRRQLPNRRECLRLQFEHAGFRYSATVGLRPDTGEPAEIFLHTAKAGTAVEGMARDAAVIASLALQHDCPLGTLRHALTRLEADEPAGPLAALLDILSTEMPLVAVPVQPAIQEQTQ